MPESHVVVEYYANMNSLIVHKVYDRKVTECGQNPRFPKWQLVMPDVPVAPCVTCFHLPRKKQSGNLATAKRPYYTIQELPHAEAPPEAAAAQDPDGEGLPAPAPGGDVEADSTTQDAGPGLLGQDEGS